MKTRTWAKIIVICSALSLQLIFLFVVPNHTILFAPADVDRIEEGPYAGNYLVTDGFDGSIKIINFATSQILWQNDDPGFFVHDADMMPGGRSIIIADTETDRVFEINISNHAILWVWYAKNSTHDAYSDYLNWTAFALQENWGAEAIAILEDFDPPDGYYTHLNTVQFLNGTVYGRSYDTILISLRNLDIVIEVNYSAQLGEPGYMNITWYYGIPGNHSILNHIHAPKRWLNGHVTIADSENERVIEIDENNQLVWEYRDKRLRWPRDCELLPNGNYLITDSTNNRIIEVNMSTKQIVKTFSALLSIPYEADYTSENQVIVGNTMGNNIIVYDYSSGSVAQVIGINWFFLPLILTFVMLIGYQAVDCMVQFRSMKDKSIVERLTSHKIYSKLILIGVQVGIILLIYQLISFMWQYSIWKIAEYILHP